MIELKDAEVREIDLDGAVVPILNLRDVTRIDVELRFRGRDYRFSSSVLVKGYGAVLPGRVQDALAEGREAMLVQRGERYYLYLTPPSGQSGR